MPGVGMSSTVHRVFPLLLCALFVAARPVRAQDPPPRIPWFVFDVHGAVPRFPSDNQELADSRGMNLTELPGRGLGVQVGAHVYPFRWHAVTFGAGGELALSRARKSPPNGVATLRPSEERFRSIAPQLSFNFGTGQGWSYLSGGLGQSTWAITPVGQENYPPDSEKLKTINYGGGARWFIKPHLAFSFDVRFYAINPGLSFGSRPGSPRTTLMVIGAGMSIK
jgi:hypothetical protein